MSGLRNALIGLAVLLLPSIPFGGVQDAWASEDITDKQVKTFKLNVATFALLIGDLGACGFDVSDMKDKFMAGIGSKVTGELQEWAVEFVLKASSHEQKTIEKEMQSGQQGKRKYCTDIVSAIQNTKGEVAFYAWVFGQIKDQYPQVREAWNAK